jgi:hypothetical protein
VAGKAGREYLRDRKSAAYIEMNEISPVQDNAECYGTSLFMKVS